MENSFVPDDFHVPSVLETEKFRLRMLSVDDIEKDYEAVMSSKENLRTVFASKHYWPPDDMTIEKDLEDLKRHQKEFLERKAFAYTVMKLDESQCLGCVYIFPPKIHQFDVIVFLWVRDSEFNNLDTNLFYMVRKWLEKEWPFKRVAFPGREISWKEWEKINSKSTL